jgi:Tfp pilus assembly protein PilO
MFLQKLNKREKLVLVATVALAVTTSVYGFIVEPVLFRWQRQNEQIEAKLNVYLRNKKLLMSLPAVEAQYAKFPSLVEKNLSEEKEISQVLRTIQGISNVTSCNVVNIKPQPVQRSRSYKWISFDVTVSGNIESIGQFLYKIETSADLLRVKRVSLSAQSGASGGLKGILYIRKLVVL